MDSNSHMLWQALGEQLVTDIPSEPDEPQIQIAKGSTPNMRDRKVLADYGHLIYTQFMGYSVNKHPYAQIREEHTGNGQKFTDLAFPANHQSLIHDWNLLPSATRKLWKTFHWKRVTDIYPQPIKVFNVVDPNDILQGNLGNCYFLSALSALAEFPQRVERIFGTQQFQESGCYSVKLYDMGKLTEYAIDDYFPVTQDGGIAFSGPNFQSGVTELWVLLAEKTWAKRFGSYFDIDTGLTEDVLRDFTGAPCETVQTDDPDLWDKIYDANVSNQIITATSHGKDGCGDLINEMGLVSMHAYAVIDTQEVVGPRGPANILMIRNPWGSQEWTGQWSDSDTESWTTDLKAKLNWDNSNDGRFWMSVDDFCKYFTAVTICRVHDDYYHEGLHDVQQMGGFNVYHVNFKVNTHAYFIVTQMDGRRFEEELEYDYAPVRIIIAKIEGSKLRYIDGSSEVGGRDIWREFELPAGDYAVFVELDWLGPWTEKFGFSIYSAIRPIIKKETFKYKDFLQRVYTLELAKERALAREIGPDIRFYAADHCGERESEKFYKEGILYDAIENGSIDKKIELSVVHKTFENLQLFEPYQGDSYSLTLLPGEFAVVVKKQLNLLEDIGTNIAIQKKITQVQNYHQQAQRNRKFFIMCARLFILLRVAVRGLAFFKPLP